MFSAVLSSDGAESGEPSPVPKSGPFATKSGQNDEKFGNFIHYRPLFVDGGAATLLNRFFLVYSDGDIFVDALHKSVEWNN